VASAFAAERTKTLSHVALPLCKLEFVVDEASGERSAGSVGRFPLERVVMRIRVEAEVVGAAKRAVLPGAAHVTILEAVEVSAGGELVVGVIGPMGHRAGAAIFLHAHVKARSDLINHKLTIRIRLRIGVVLRGILSGSPLSNHDVADGLRCAIARGCSTSGRRVESLLTAHVVPGGHDKAHVSPNRVVEGEQVVLAVGLHLNCFTILLKSGANFPERCVLTV